MSLLSATAIDYSIDQVPILKGIDFHVDKGELVG